MYEKARPLSIEVGRARSVVTDHVLRALLEGEPLVQTLQAAGYSGQWYYLTEQVGHDVMAWLRFTYPDAPAEL